MEERKLKHIYIPNLSALFMYHSHLLQAFFLSPFISVLFICSYKDCDEKRRGRTSLCHSIQAFSFEEGCWTKESYGKERFAIENARENSRSSHKEEVYVCSKARERFNEPSFPAFFNAHMHFAMKSHQEGRMGKPCYYSMSIIVTPVEKSTVSL